MIIDTLSKALDLLEGSSSSAIGRRMLDPPLQAGCCKPPTHCGFVYESANEWKAPETGVTSEDPDCKIWSNEYDELCYNCGSCKAGYLAIFLKSWKRLVGFDLILLILLIFIFVLGCCALL
ncbi:hypothetical protein Dimus_004126 [Dionaea muscipula]